MIRMLLNWFFFWLNWDKIRNREVSRKLIRVFSSAPMVLFDHIFHFSKRLPISSNTQCWLAIDQHPSDIPIYTKSELKVPPRKKKNCIRTKSPFGNVTWSFWWMYQKCPKCKSRVFSVENQQFSIENDPLLIETVLFQGIIPHIYPKCPMSGQNQLSSTDIWNRTGKFRRTVHFDIWNSSL